MTELVDLACGTKIHLRLASNEEPIEVTNVDD